VPLAKPNNSPDELNAIYDQIAGHLADLDKLVRSLNKIVERRAKALGDDWMLVGSMIHVRSMTHPTQGAIVHPALSAKKGLGALLLRQYSLAGPASLERGRSFTFRSYSHCAPVIQALLLSHAQPLLHEFLRHAT